jgi:hypothetical protein
MRKLVAVRGLVPLALLPALLAGVPPAGAQPPPESRRVAILVGANAAAPGRKPLVYSHQDVDRMAAVLHEVGGFRKEDLFVLRDPSPKGLIGALTAATSRLADRPESLLYFYYSGHADEQALYPGGQAVPLARLRAMIDEARVAVKIGVVDACRGGSWTRAKGLAPEEPFAVKWPVSLDNEGSVLIASSSGLESAHESDELQGSFFTYHFVAGLRGAADRNSNGDVTLTEAFEYAKERTIRDSTAATHETQRPSYAVNLRGRRDLVLAQMAVSPSTLSVHQQVGPLELIHAESGLQLLELPPGPRRVKLAVPPGAYIVRKWGPQGNLVKRIVVNAGVANVIDEEQLTLVGQARLVAKGPPAQVAVPRPAPARPEPPAYVKPAALGFATASVMSFALAIKFALDVNRIQKDLDPYRRFDCEGITAGCNGTGTRVGPITQAEQQYVGALQKEGKRFENYQYISLGVSAALALASAPFFYKWASAAEGGQSLALAPVASPDGGGFLATVRY